MKKDIYKNLNITDDIIIQIIDSHEELNYLAKIGTKHIFVYKSLADYVINRYEDSDDRKESLYRIYAHIEKRPTCKNCGKRVKFKGKLTINEIKENKIVQGHGFDMFCSKKCSVSNGELLERNKRGCLLKYGVDNASKLAEVKEKRVKTMIEKYGVTNSYLIPEIYENARLDVSVIKRVNNCKNTLMEKYGVNCSFNLPWVKCNKNTTEAKIKEYNTKLKNKSFKGKTSNEENTVFIILSNKFGENDIVRPYIDERYKNPKTNRFYECDFYIKSLDLFIEYQGYWTHGPHPFNEKSYEDIEILNNIINKAKHSTKYKDAIITWTERDVIKRNVAKENKIKYLELWPYRCCKLTIEEQINNYIKRALIIN